MIGIVKYGSGNITALANIYKRLNISASFVADVDQLRSAERLILPGVGAFDGAMKRLNDSGLRETLDDIVSKKTTPILGICVGMQMMAERSDEGKLEGLGWFEADVKKFDVSAFMQRTHLPHMGWNDADPRLRDGLFKGLGDDSRFYFLHSYYFVPRKPDDVLAETDYNGTFASSVGNGFLYGVQFHPEKSHQWGVKLLKNFAEL